MNLPKISSVKAPKNALSYFRFYLLANWQQFVLYAILCFLALVLPAIINITEAQRYGEMYSMDCYDTAQALCVVYVFVSGVLGLFSGMSANSYVNSKQATNCFHSIPMRRETLFVTEGVARFCYYLLSSWLMYSVSMFLLMLTYGAWQNAFTMIWNFWFIGIFCYLIVFTLFQLASALTATAGFRFCMAALIAFLPIVLYFLVLGCVNLGMNSIDVEYYMYLPAVNWLCPAYMILYVALGLANGELSYPLLQILSLLVPSIVYYTAAILIHRKRRSEMAANSVIWNKIKGIVKYLVVFTAGICGALFMISIMGGELTWMVFGMICGLVLSFILMNFLINRTTKSMFKGLAGLGITAVATVLFLLVFMVDIFHLDSFLYSINNIHSVELRFQYSETPIVLDEREDIEKILPAIQAMNEMTYLNVDYAVAVTENILNTEEDVTEKYKEYFGRFYDEETNAYLIDNYDSYLKQFEETLYIPEEETTPNISFNGYQTVTVEEAPYYYYFDNSVMNSSRIYYVIKPKFGIALAKTGRTHPISVQAKYFDDLTYTNGFLQSIEALEQELTVDNYLSFNVDYDEYFWQPYNEKEEDTVAYLKKLIHAYKTEIPAGVESPLIGTIEIYLKDNNQYYLPLYAGMTNVMSTLSDGLNDHLGRIRSSYDGAEEDDHYVPGETDYIDWKAEQFMAVMVVERGTGRSWLTENKKDISDILSGTTRILYWRDNIFSGCGDTQYVLVGITGFQDYPDTWATEMMLFRDGMVPACVTEAFS